MDRKSLTFFVGLAVTIILRAIPTTAQPSAVQPNAGTQDRPNSSQQPRPTPPQAKGTNEERTTTTQTQQPATPPPPPIQALGAANQTEPATSTKQDQVSKFLDKLIDPISLATVAIAFLAFLQVRIYRQMRDHTKAIERAYVGFGTWLSEGDKDKDDFRTLKMTLQLFNFGNTPADIEEVVMAYHVGAEISKPGIYESLIHTDKSRVFLVKHGDVSFRKRDFKIPHIDWVRVVTPTEEYPAKLWLLGYVIYRDRFKQRHRAGYARIYTPGAHGDINDFAELKKLPEKLAFVTLPDYNYDREIDENGNPKG